MPRVVEIDVEADEIDAGGMEKFRRRKIHKRDEALWIGALDDGREFIDETLDACRAVPASDVGRNFVGQRKGEHRRMAGERFRHRAHSAARVVHHDGIIEEAGVFVPVALDEQFQSVLLREIEKPRRRDVIDAEAIGVEFLDQREVALDLFAWRELPALGVRRERPIGDATWMKFAAAEPEKFSVGQDAFRRRRAMLLNRQQRRLGYDWWFGDFWTGHKDLMFEDAAS